MSAISKSLARRFSRSARFRKKLANIYLAGNGIEVGALHNPLPVGSQARVQYVDRLPQAGLHQHYPELGQREIVVPDIVDNGEELSLIQNDSLDFIIANHFIEHCENPIATIINFFSKLKPDGIVYLAVPDKRFTFDRQRESTSVDHLEGDYLDGGINSRSAHYRDYARHALLNDYAGEPQLGKLTREMMETRYSIHFHVWTFAEFVDFLHWLKDRHLSELEILKATPNRREGVFILQKKFDDSTPQAAG